MLSKYKVHAAYTLYIMFNVAAIINTFFTITLFTLSLSFYDYFY